MHTYLIIFFLSSGSNRRSVPSGNSQQLLLPLFPSNLQKDSGRGASTAVQSRPRVCHECLLPSPLFLRMTWMLPSISYLLIYLKRSTSGTKIWACSVVSVWQGWWQPSPHQQCCRGMALCIGYKCRWPPHQNSEERGSTGFSHLHNILQGREPPPPRPIYAAVSESQHSCGKLWAEGNAPILAWYCFNFTWWENVHSLFHWPFETAKVMCKNDVGEHETPVKVPWKEIVMLTEE